MRIAIVGAVCLVLGACSTTTYKDQAAQLGTAATALGGAMPTAPKVGANQIIDIKTDLVLGNFPIAFSTDCSLNAQIAYQAFLDSLSKSRDEQDAAYVPLTQISACDVVQLNPVATSAAAVPPVALVKSPAVKSGSAKPNAANVQLAADEQAEADAALNAAGRLKAKQAAQAAQQVALGQTPAPDASGQKKCGNVGGSCSLDDYATQIKAYGAAITAAGTAQSVTEAQAALTKADTATGSLLKLANANPIAAPITDAIATVGKLALQQAQYEAMRRAVLLFDARWPLAAPAVAAAARTRQALLISYAADTSLESAVQAQQYLNDDKYYHSPAERLQLFEVLDAKVTTSAAALKTAEADPAQAIAAFSKANHDLAFAIDQGKGDVSVLLDDLKALSDQVAAVQKAAQPATPTKTSGATSGK